MSSRPHGLLRAALRRLSPAPPSDSDADLLDRYVASRDEAAFAALVRRHGPMVLGVCRRRLGGGPDAEDAYQVTFMVLARDAGRIGNGAALPGWLYRVAYLIALKQSGKLGRRPEALPEEPFASSQTPDAEAAGRESLAILDEELNALPDKLRSVLVLCGLEDRTNAEAARLLGCPTGTVDSRLSAARQKLRERLARRGLAALVASLPVASEAVRADDVAHAALVYVATRGVATDPLSTFADGVTPIMSTTKLKLLAAAGMCLALFGTAGFGLIHATGPDDPKAKSETKLPEAKPDLSKKAVPREEAKPAEDDKKVIRDEQELRAALKQPARIRNPGALSIDAFLEQLYADTGIIVRLDMASYMRADPPPDWKFYETKIQDFPTRGMTVGEMLTEVLAPIYIGGGEGGTKIPFTYRIRDNVVLITPAYVPPVVPGLAAATGADHPPLVDQKRLLEQIVGEPVSLAIEDRPFTDAVKELRKLTGANIVIDARCKEQAKQPVTGSFSDVRLLTALSVLADMCDLKPVAMNNVYYLTTPANAAKLQKQVNADLFGAPPVTVPAGYVTDGIHLYEKPANLKPADLQGLGGGLGGGVSGVVPAPPPEKK